MVGDGSADRRQLAVAADAVAARGPGGVAVLDATADELGDVDVAVGSKSNPNGPRLSKSVRTKSLLGLPARSTPKVSTRPGPVGFAPETTSLVGRRP